jgi:hypothetical protein
LLIIEEELQAEEKRIMGHPVNARSEKNSLKIH